MSSNNFGRDYYQSYIARRNAGNPDFYLKRKEILVSTFRSVLDEVFKEYVSEKWDISGLRILDAGSGEDVVREAIKPISDAEVISLDLDLEILRGEKPSVNAEVQQLPIAARVFDVVVSTELIEHLESGAGRAFIAEVFRVLKQGGVLYLETPNPQSLEALVTGEGWSMYLPEHLQFYTPDLIKMILEELGFSEVVVKTRYEKDEQIDESWKILAALNGPLQYVPWRLKLPVVEKLLEVLDMGSKTVAIATK